MAPRTPKDPDKKSAKPARAEKADQPATRTQSTGAAKPALKVVEPAPAAKAPDGALKFKDLVDSVALATGGKKPDVRKTIQATLAALGEALASGRALVVPPLGKLRVVKSKGPALTLKLRRIDGTKAAGLALADDGEDG
jgi:hypothetical protein